MKIERFFSKGVLITPILGLSIFLNTNWEVKAQANKPGPDTKKLSAPLIIKPKTDEEAKPVDISELKSGEESLRSNINLETENGVNKLVSEGDEKILKILENPEVLKITPIAVGKVVEISVSDEQIQRGEEKTTKEIEIEPTAELSENQESLETKEDLETLETLETLEPTPTKSAESSESIDIDTDIDVERQEPSITKEDKDSQGGDTSEDKSKNISTKEETTIDTENLESNIEAEKNIIIDPSLNPALDPKPNESLKEALDPTISKKSDDVEIAVSTAQGSTSVNNNPQIKEVDKALTPKYKELAQKLQKEIDKIKESGRSVTPQERVAFTKQFEDGKRELREEYIAMQIENSIENVSPPTLNTKEEISESKQKDGETEEGTKEILGTMPGESELSSLDNLENF